MTNYVMLWNWTEQGIKNYKQTKDRAQSVANEAEKAGIKLKEFLWTMGEIDGIAVFEAQDDVAISKLILKLAAAGNVRTRVMRGFNRNEISAVIG